MCLHRRCFLSVHVSILALIWEQGIRHDGTGNVAGHSFFSEIRASSIRGEDRALKAREGGGSESQRSISFKAPVSQVLKKSVSRFCCNHLCQALIQNICLLIFLHVSAQGCCQNWLCTLHHLNQLYSASINNLTHTNSLILLRSFSHSLSPASSCHQRWAWSQQNSIYTVIPHLKPAQSCVFVHCDANKQGPQCGSSCNLIMAVPLSNRYVFNWWAVLIDFS